MKTPKGKERNGPCPCGSGKKLKKCCARGEVISRKYKEEKEAFYAYLRKRSEEKAAEEEAYKEKYGHKKSKLILSASIIAAISCGLPYLESQENKKD